MLRWRGRLQSDKIEIGDDLKVISRTSTLPYRTRPEKISEIGRQLGLATWWKPAVNETKS